MIHHLPVDLPYVQSLTDKFRSDLFHGFRILGSKYDADEIIRVWTKGTKEEQNSAWQFLLIATAKPRLAVPVSALELFAYTSGKQSWRLQLIQHPFPEPHWRSHWKEMVHTVPVGIPDVLIQRQVIEDYLKSGIDMVKTQEAFRISQVSHGVDKIAWIREEYSS